MIKFENLKIEGFEPTIRGMRNPMNSWEKSDSWFYDDDDYYEDWTFIDAFDINGSYQEINGDDERFVSLDVNGVYIGPKDHNLMMKLAKAGSEHSKYRRMIVVWIDITAPLYWWKEFDTYKVGTVANSCSTMHKIHAKEFELDDFSHEHLLNENLESFKEIIKSLNLYRNKYIVASKIDDIVGEEGLPSKKTIWWQMIQLLPSSYNQKRTVMLNYENLAHIYRQRKDHKLDEWREFCKWIEELPYSEIITLEED